MSNFAVCTLEGSSDVKGVIYFEDMVKGALALAWWHVHFFPRRVMARPR